ncbi:MAG: hypothetical protein DRN60_01470 [Thaumarchaeota archaeon]|nr:MAG: hypothetical protein DRN60_01470 [Nitrososphaerota archaeon]
MRILRFGDKLPSSEECGCGLEHDRTLREVVIGPLKESLEYILEYGVEGPFAVFYDKVTYEVAGRFVQKILSGGGFFVDGPTYEEAEEKAEKVKGFKTIVGVGGGTVIDVAKYAAFRSGASFISIPTSPSHDGIASPTASLFSGGRRISKKTRPPIISLIDPSILSNAPRFLKASGFGDLIAKIVSLKDWQLGRDELGEPYCKTAESFILKSLRLMVEALEIRDSFERIERLAEGLIYSGVAMMLVGSSRPASGSEHLISHYLDMNLERRVPHGIQCALAALPMALYHERYNENWWRDEYDWMKIRILMERAGIPLTLKEAEISEDLMVKALVEAWKIRPNRYTILHKRKLDPVEARKLLKDVQLI